MRAVQVTRFGGPEVLMLNEVADPVAGPGEVVVDVSVVDVMTLEAQLRAGWGAEYFALTPPYVPGGGVAGRVSAVGEGVDPGWIGRRVVVPLDGGGYAERVVVPADRPVAVPDAPALREAAALMQIGPAALALLDEAGLGPKDHVLVTAAGGALGSLLVRSAHAAGARVVAAARGERKLNLARDLGADAAVDYSEAGWAERVTEATGGVGVTVVFDGAGGRIGEAALAASAPGCRFFAYGVGGGAFAEIDPHEAKRREVTVIGIERVQFAPEEARRLVERTLAEAAAGRLDAVVGQTFPLERAVDAHAAIEARDTVGKTLLLIGEES